MDGLPAEARLAAAFAVGLLVTALTTAPVRRLAIRIDFFDRPIGYKQHLRPTPYLGGAAVMAGFLVGAIALGSGLSRFAAATLCAIALFAVGTLDDRVGLGIAPRLGVQLAAGTALWLSGAGWELGSGVTDLTLTLVWVIGVTNAFNLMDNLDGATATVGGVSAAGIGVLAVSAGDAALGAFAFALAGACTGFLPHNLARPSRIFLGDGGSASIGFLVAATVMMCPHASLGLTALLAFAPLAGLPIFDTTLVVISRYRRGAPILSGGRDHLTHRLFEWLRSERSVAIVLAVGQSLLVLLALGLRDLSPEGVLAATAGYLLAGAVALALLEGPLLTGAPEEQTT
jgi:UDP-GlcNAc:undecaprenyl-phosphate GlcNAc-1-phosphate transferase